MGSRRFSGCCRGNGLQASIRQKLQQQPESKEPHLRRDAPRAGILAKQLRGDFDLTFQGPLIVISQAMVGLEHPKAFLSAL